MNCRDILFTFHLHFVCNKYRTRPNTRRRKDFRLIRGIRFQAGPSTSIHIQYGHMVVVNPSIGPSQNKYSVDVVGGCGVRSEGAKRAVTFQTFRL